MKPIKFIACALIIFFSACNEGSKSTTEKTVMDSSKMGEHTMAGMNDVNGGMMAPMNTMMTSMKEMKLTGDVDYDFVNLMIAHHQAAIDMANLEQSHGKDEALKAMAKGMIAAQQNEINVFQDIRKNLAVPSGQLGAEAKSEMMGSMENMMTGMNEVKMTGNIDKDFALMMIPHHEGAVAMAKDLLANGKNDDLKKMAQKIIDDQTKEIADMKAWLAVK